MFKQKLELIKSKIIDKITEIRLSSGSDNDEESSEASAIDSEQDLTDDKVVSSEELDDIEELDLEADLEKLKEDALGIEGGEAEVSLENPTKKKKGKKEKIKKSANGKSKIIQVFIGLVLIFMLVDEVFLNDDADSGEDTSSPKINRSKVTKRPKINRKTKQFKQNKKFNDASKVIMDRNNKIIDEKSTPPEDVEATKNKIITNTNNLEKEKALALKKIEEELEMEKQKEELRVKQEKLEQKQQELEIELAKKNKVKEEKKVKELEELQQAKSKKSLKEREKLLKTGFDRKTKTKTVFIDPPEYSYAGRGLVYNCTGKHWACIDKSNFLQCRQNMNWNLENKKGIACVVKDVYASYDDCKIVQIYNINENIEIKECQ